MRARGARWLVMLALDALENFFAMHGYFFRCVNTNTNLVAFYTQNSY